MSAIVQKDFSAYSMVCLDHEPLEVSAETYASLGVFKSLPRYCSVPSFSSSRQTPGALSHAWTPSRQSHMPDSAPDHCKSIFWISLSHTGARGVLSFGLEDYLDGCQPNHLGLSPGHSIGAVDLVAGGISSPISIMELLVIPLAPSTPDIWTSKSS